MINLHQIDMGEASALVLAQQLATQGTAALLLIDEHRGRQAAQYCQVAIIGTAGLLVLAKPANRRCRNGKPEPNGLAAWRSSCWPLWKSTVSKYWPERRRTLLLLRSFVFGAKAGEDFFSRDAIPAVCAFLNVSAPPKLTW